MYQGIEVAAHAAEPTPLKLFSDKGGPKPAVLGGGVAGMSAAHELIERGIRVAVFEKQPELCGGKARSLPGPGRRAERELPRRERRDGLPAREHGLRFFPRCYKHVTDTMSRIPFGKGRVIESGFKSTHGQPERVDELILINQSFKPLRARVRFDPRLA